MTIFTFQSKIDFTFLYGFLFVGTIILIFWGLFSVIFGFQTSFLYSLFGSLLFSLWILADTSIMLKRAEIQFMFGKQPSWADASIFAVNLYLDAINLFLHLLQLLSSNQ